MSNVLNVSMRHVLNDADLLLELITSSTKLMGYDETQTIIQPNDEEFDFEYSEIEVENGFNALARRLLSEQPDLAFFGLLNVELSYDTIGQNAFGLRAVFDLYHFERVIVNPELKLTYPAYLTKRIEMNAEITASFNKDREMIEIKFDINDVDVSAGVISELNLLEQGIEPAPLLELTKLHMGDKFIPYATDALLEADEDEGDDETDEDGEEEDEGDEE